MRQSIALSFVLYGFSLLREKKYITCFIPIIFGMFFHITALIGIIVLLLYIMIARKTNTENNKRNIFISVKSLFGLLGLISIAVIVLNKFPEILTFFGMDRFAGYFKGSFQIMPRQILVKLPTLFAIIYCLKFYKNKKIGIFYLVVSAIDLMLCQLTSQNQFAIRIAMYFSIFYSIMIDEITQNLKGSDKKLIITFYLLYCMLYWLYYIYFVNTNETLPYLIGD
jgi:hypothetical protein